jgi:NAD(P)H-dependent FMN reductase
MITISVIIGSTRQGRFSEKPAQWILQELQKREAIEVRLLDLRDFPMPFFDQPMPPAMPGRPAYEHDVVKKWTAQIAASDGFVFVTPEYNYGTSAVLKNAIDWVYPEWNRKAAAFVSYGSRFTFPLQRYGRISREATSKKASPSWRSRRT